MNIFTILVAILVFGILILVHELGHFFAAKSAGIKVNEFALGMGPKLFSVTKGETVYALRAFPIGGFCAMEGEEESSGDKHAYCNASLPRRFLVMISGSAMNLLLGFVLVSILTAQLNLLATTRVASFSEDSRSSERLQVGDEILSVNNHRVRTGNDLTYEFMRDRDGVMDIEVSRDGQRVLLDGVEFKMQDIPGGGQIIFLDFRVYGEQKTPLRVVSYTLNWTASLVKQVWGSLIDLATGRFGLNQLSGPVGVTKTISEATSMGIESLLFLVSFITVNLGVFNLLPLPALDGGKVLFLLIELIFRKPVDAKYEGWVHAAGFVLLIGLMIFVTFNDILRLI